MRVFQNYGLMPAYRPRLERLAKDATTFSDRIACFVKDRYGAMHLLFPAHVKDPSAFFTNGDDVVTQAAWARENGLPDQSTPEAILLAQIEHHRTEVFYNLDPMRFGGSFLRRLPGHVKRRIAWRAAPSEGADFAGYDLMVCNFPSLLDGFRQQGLRAAWFAPSHDPALDPYASNADRPVDIAFIGTYSRHHQRRAALIEAVAAMGRHVTVALHLDSSSRFLRLAESPLGLIGPLRKHRRPALVRAASKPPVFGRDLYQVLSSARIIVNGAIDMAGQDRGNMRCWEAMGAGALLVSDEGNYPQGMTDGQTMVTYRDADQLPGLLQDLLQDRTRSQEIAHAGHQMISTDYGKEKMWHAFTELCS